MVKRTLFINYWGVEEGLTQSTSFPSLRLLQEDSRVESVVFCSIERKGKPSLKSDLGSKITFFSLISKDKRCNILNKFDDYLSFPSQLKQLVDEHNLNFIIARGASAGNLAYLLYKKTKLPFVVESFEPHAEYMLESGTWSKRSLKYQIQRFFEKKQIDLCKGLITVSDSYKKRLISEGVDSCRIEVARCPVGESFFEENKKNGGTGVVGVYVGKFGDIYYKEEVLSLFDKAYQYFEGFQLKIATPQNDSFIQVLRNRYPDAFIDFVPFENIPGFLSSADFAFATVREAPVRLFCSPIKVGEYWAQGLPVMLTKGVGDDAGIIEHTGLGALFSINEEDTIDIAFEKIGELIKDTSSRNKIRQLAVLYRSLDHTKRAYDQLVFK
ncbi:glycosyltransferase [Cyclobacteriaceae bacterium]|nr:glycosyltransferase [Cyclobacteriaceae bacterium]